MPFHTAARASIGKCLSSLQFYYATRKGILIPWKPVIAERFKTLGDLLIADRGGFIFEPEIGAHEQVAEFDFVSLYPNIMLKKNLSAETINCDCCPDSKLSP
jgi:DNA polymerase, archaea type